jgi:hypothetical protein
MGRFIPSLALALGCFAVAAHAQETTTRTETKSSGGQPQVVTYTGCVATGTETKTYILNKVAPITTTTRVQGLGGDSTTVSTEYVLVPGEKVEVQSHVGKKVEVTGMLIPAGNTRTETTTKVENEDAKDTKTVEKSSTKNAMAQFRVTSIKDLGESCQ